ncbi:LysR family transcriptional regulator [Paraburkholderia bannensis]|uniref:LysR family transcriptional regulator n=1 Tax=Paraburkholderia bannensis TaxID=765414 RepID=UPI002AB669D2|nr:LysR substrate-binding domain-containing protein [Paraburkholderia bannensis]
MDRIAEMSSFVAVVENGDFSRAARKLALTPSGVSRSVSRLEARIGTKLMSRSPRGIVLTQEGRQYLSAARKALAAIEEADEIVFGALRGVLRVSCLPAFASCQLAPLMKEFHRRYPEVRVEFQLETDERKLPGRDVDIAITSGMLPDSGVVGRRIATTRWLICASPGYLEQHGTPSTRDQLASHVTLNFTVAMRWNTWSVPDARGNHHVFENVGSFGASDGAMIMAMARSGVGIARLAEYHARPELNSGALVELFAGAEATEEPIYLLYEKHRHMSRRVLAFVDFIREHIQLGGEPWRAAK